LDAPGSAPIVSRRSLFEAFFGANFESGICGWIGRKDCIVALTSAGSAPWSPAIRFDGVLIPRIGASVSRCRDGCRRTRIVVLDRPLGGMGRRRFFIGIPHAARSRTFGRWTVRLRIPILRIPILRIPILRIFCLVDFGLEGLGGDRGLGLFASGIGGNAKEVR
jgi:hypothetical protein